MVGRIGTEGTKDTDKCLPNGCTHSFDASIVRKTLAQEQRRLSDELERTLLAYRDRLDRFTHHVSEMHDEDVEREADAMREIQARLRQAIKRAGLVERETAELMHEWEDWERARVSDAPMDLLAFERREMVRSELAVRGKEDANNVFLHNEKATMDKAESVVKPDGDFLILENAGLVEKAARDEDALAEWDELLESVLSSSDDERASPISVEQYVETIFGRRMEAAERKRLDRASGIRRDRSAALSFH